MVEISKTDASVDTSASTDSTNPVQPKKTTQAPALETSLHATLAKLPKNATGPATPNLTPASGKLPEPQSPKESIFDGPEGEEIPAGVKGIVDMLETHLPEQKYREIGEKAYQIFQLALNKDPEVSEHSSEVMQSNLDKLTRQAGFLQGNMVDGNIKRVRDRTIDHDKQHQTENVDENRFLHVLDPWQDRFTALGNDFSMVQLLIDCNTGCASIRAAAIAEKSSNYSQGIQSSLTTMNGLSEKLTKKMGKLSGIALEKATIVQFYIAETTATASIGLHNESFSKMLGTSEILELTNDEFFAFWLSKHAIDAASNAPPQIRTRVHDEIDAYRALVS